MTKLLLMIKPIYKQSVILNILTQMMKSISMRMIRGNVSWV